ncbi:MAG: class I SAM-dependent methyltransferase [Pseudomonadota bacterium]
MAMQTLAGEQLDAVGAAAYADKTDTYFVGARQDFADVLPVDRNARILEIGCGSGETAALIKRDGKCGTYAGVELFSEAAERARRHIDHVIVGDIAEVDLPFEPASFDVLIMSEVLEHLADPWAVLRRIAPLMRPGAKVLASSPNVSNWRILKTIAAGDFRHDPSGVFDRTHLRWFTPKTFRAMFEETGFTVVRLGPVTPFAARTRLISKLSGGRLDHLFMTQIKLEAIKR